MGTIRHASATVEVRGSSKAAMSSERSDFDGRQSDEFRLDDHDDLRSLGRSIDGEAAHAARYSDAPNPRRTADTCLRITRSPGWFSDSSKVKLVECNPGEKVRQSTLDDVGLEDHFKVQMNGGTERFSLQVAFIRWKKSRQFDISLRGMDTICKAFKLSPTFVSGILEEEYMYPLGYGYIIDRKNSGVRRIPGSRLFSLEIFYEYSFSLTSGKAYVVRQYDNLQNRLTYVCINCPESVADSWLSEIESQDLSRSSLDSFLLDVTILEESLKSFTKDISELRLRLLEYERKQHLHSPKETILDLHKIAQRWHILLGNLSSFEQWLLFILKSEKAPHPYDETPENMRLELLHTKVVHLKTWVTNYKDRTNIRINLSTMYSELVLLIICTAQSFHLSQQSDNDTNLKISNYTSVIARDTQQDSSSMITIAAVTMFFLPGTFICAIFSMVFFNVEHDANGAENFWVSERWWYYLAITVPLTLVVFAVWVVWRGWRFRRHQAVNAKFLEEKDEL